MSQFRPPPCRVRAPKPPTAVEPRRRAWSKLGGGAESGRAAFLGPWKGLGTKGAAIVRAQADGQAR